MQECVIDMQVSSKSQVTAENQVSQDEYLLLSGQTSHHLGQVQTNDLPQFQHLNLLKIAVMKSWAFSSNVK